MNNELVGLNGITRKAIDTVRKYGMLSLDTERRRKPHDCHGRNTTYTGRSRWHAQMYNSHGQALYPQWSAWSHQSRRSLSSKIRRSRQLHNQKRYKKRQQIEKATVWWQWTIENLVAIRSQLDAWKTESRRPRDSLPIFSIADDAKQINGYTRMGMTERKRVYP